MVQSVPLPAGWGQAQIYAPQQHAARIAGTARSYDHLGNQLVWCPPHSLPPGSRFACDLEASGFDSQVRAAHFQLPPEEFFGRWVVAEVFAKLSDIPVLLWVKRYGLLQVEKDLSGRFDQQKRGIAVKGLVLGHSHCPPGVMAFGFSRPAPIENGSETLKPQIPGRTHPLSKGGAVAATVIETETTVCQEHL